MTGTEKVTLTQRLQIFLLLSAEESQAVLADDFSHLNIDQISSRTQTDKATVTKYLQSLSTLQAARLNPNRVNEDQMRLIPEIDPDQVTVVIQGRPYFSISELESASEVEKGVLEEIFQIPPWRFHDRLSDREVRFDHVPNQFLVRSAASFETDPILSLGYIESKGSSQGNIRLVVPNPLEQTEPPHGLKHALQGNVFPVLRDAEGIERFFSPGLLDVWFHRNVAESQARGLLEAFGLKVQQGRPGVGYYLAEIQDAPADKDLTRATLEKIALFNQRDDIRFSEPGQIAFEFSDQLPTEPDFIFPVLEFEDAMAGNRNWNTQLIEVSAAHTITKGTNQVTLFIVDSGIRLDHPDISDALRPDWRSLDLNFDVGVPESETSPEENTLSHGTRVAGVAAGRAVDFQLGARGVAPKCPILPVKISGTPAQTSYGLRAAAILEVIDKVAANERGIINLSWSTNGEHIGIREALIEATQNEIAVVCSAGNYWPHETQVPNKSHYPSRYAFLPEDTEADIAARRKIKGVCSVAAVNANKLKASYSYYGSNAVTVSAPGGEPGSTGRGIFVASAPENYVYGAGTSYAAPHVTGLLGLLVSLDPNLSAHQAIDIVRQTATDLDHLNPMYLGMLGGLVNARAAVQVVANASNPPPSNEGTNSSGTPDPNEPSTSDPQPTSQLDINAATLQQWIDLPLIGSWSAQKIVDYRYDHGPFTNIWDLITTGAVDAWTLKQIRPLITVGIA